MPYRSAGCHFQSSLHSPPGSCRSDSLCFRHFFFQAEDGIRDYKVTGVQTCALPIWTRSAGGLRIIPTHGAGRELVAALARGEAVALVADRVVAGAGASVELFGAPTRLPRSEERRVGKESRGGGAAEGEKEKVRGAGR